MSTIKDVEKMPDASRWTPAHAAVDRAFAVMSAGAGVTAAMRDAMAAIVNFNAVDPRYGRGLLHRAVHHAPQDFLIAFVERGGNLFCLDDCGASLLHHCPDVSCLRYLISQGLDVHGKDKTGATALHSCLDRWSTTVVNVLLEYGADPNAVNNMGATPLHVALNGTGDLHSRCRAVELLGKAGARFDILDGDGKPVLHYISDIRLLLEMKRQGADIEAVDSQGCRLLQWAIADDNEGLAAALIGIGASVKGVATRKTKLNKLLLTRPLVAAVMSENVDVFHPCLDRLAPADAKADIAAALKYAKAKKMSPFVNILLAHAAKMQANEAIESINQERRAMAP